MLWEPVEDEAHLSPVTQPFRGRDEARGKVLPRVPPRSASLLSDGKQCGAYLTAKSTLTASGAVTFSVSGAGCKALSGTLPGGLISNSSSFVYEI